MTPDQMAAQMERVGSGIREAARRAVEDTLLAAFDLAYAYSSGPYSSRELAALGHPFAVRHGAPQLDPTVINVQSGRFRDAWELEGPIDSGGGVRGSLWNRSPEAEFLQGGTRYMFERPIADRVQIEVEPVFQANVERQLTLLLR